MQDSVQLIDQCMQALHVAKYDPRVTTYNLVDEPYNRWMSHASTHNLSPTEQVFHSIIIQHYNELPPLKVDSNLKPVSEGNVLKD